MRISKKVMSFVLIAAFMVAAASSHASSSCNMRSGVARTSNTNPEKSTASKSVSKSTHSTKTAKTRGHK